MLRVDVANQVELGREAFFAVTVVAGKHEALHLYSIGCTPNWARFKDVLELINEAVTQRTCERLFTGYAI